MELPRGPRRTPLRWINHPTHSVAFQEPIPRSPFVAAFDFDGTLVWSDRGKPYVDKPGEWVPVTPGVIDFLNDLNRKGWTVVIFTNQKLFGSAATKRAQLANNQAKIQSFVDALDFNPTVLMATGVDEYRKPRPGMWQAFLTSTGLGGISPASPDPLKGDSPGTGSPASFYVGDAAGPEDPNPLYRWSDADRLFAQNIGLTYYRPDEIFPPIPVPEFSGEPDVIITIGQPGSGYIEYAAALHRDRGYAVLGLPDATGNAIIRTVREFPRVIIEGTNRTARERNYIADSIRHADPTRPIRYFWFTLPVRPFNALSPGLDAVQEKELKAYSESFEPVPPGTVRVS